MKKLKFLTLALITVLTCAGAASCSKDDGGVTPPGQSEIEKETGMRLTRVGNYRFNYDDKGRCIGMESISGYDDDDFTIDWDKGEFIATDSDDDMERAPVKFKTNSKGYITEFTQSWNYKEEDYSSKGSGKASLSYDKSGHLTKATYDSSESGTEDGEKFTFKGSSVYTLTWENGNLVNLTDEWEFLEDGEREKGTDSYEVTYDRTAENVYKQWTEGLLDQVLNFAFCKLGHVGMFGVGTANFPSNIEIDEEGYHTNYSVSVSTNNDDLISSERVGGWTYNYSYDDVDTRSAAFDNTLPAKARKILFPRHRKADK